LTFLLFNDFLPFVSEEQVVCTCDVNVNVSALEVKSVRVVDRVARVAPIPTDSDRFELTCGQGPARLARRLLSLLASSLFFSCCSFHCSAPENGIVK
jgi:hypothetical protein